MCLTCSFILNGHKWGNLAVELQTVTLRCWIVTHFSTLFWWKHTGKTPWQAIPIYYSLWLWLSCEVDEPCRVQAHPHRGQWHSSPHSWRPKLLPGEIRGGWCTCRYSPSLQQDKARVFTLSQNLRNTSPTVQMPSVSNGLPSKELCWRQRDWNG